MSRAVLPEPVEAPLTSLLALDPRLPAEWPLLRFRLAWRGSRITVELTQEQITFTVTEKGEDDVHVRVRGDLHHVRLGEPVTVPLDGQGLRLPGLLGDRPHLGGTRADGTKITAGVPEPMVFQEDVPPELELS